MCKDTRTLGVCVYEKREERTAYVSKISFPNLLLQFDLTPWNVHRLSLYIKHTHQIQWSQFTLFALLRLTLEPGDGILFV